MHDATLRKLQLRIEHFYALEEAPNILEFVRLSHDEPREKVLLRESGDELEVLVILPARLQNPSASPYDPDTWLQLVEAVSHFVYIAERARTGLPTTQLELELQAEVDKFVVSAVSTRRFGRSRARALHGELYENVRYLHPANSEAGARYRLANDLAARFTARLFGTARLGRSQGARGASAQDQIEARQGVLRRFYRSGQTDKIRLAHAA
jgi:hypothetical protein